MAAVARGRGGSTAPPPPLRTAVPVSAATRRSTVVLAAALAAVGCYDADALVEQARAKAVRMRLEEAPLGEFRVTLPRDDALNETTEVRLRVFGESERYKIKDIVKEAEAKRALIEDETLRTLREASRQELAESDLASLRERLLTVLNDLLTDRPLDSVGFYEVRFLRH